MRQIAALSDEQLVGRHFTDKKGDAAVRTKKVAAKAAAIRTELRTKTARALGNQLWKFGIINYPLPR